MSFNFDFKPGRLLRWTGSLALVSLVSTAQPVTVSQCVVRGWFGGFIGFRYTFCMDDCCEGYNGFVVSWPNPGEEGHVGRYDLPRSPVSHCVPPDCMDVDSGSAATCIPGDVYFSYQCRFWGGAAADPETHKRPVKWRLPDQARLRPWNAGDPFVFVDNIPPSQFGKYMVVYQNDNVGPSGILLGHAFVSGPTVQVPLQRPLIPSQMVSLALTPAVNPGADAEMIRVPRYGMIYDSGPPKQVVFNAAQTYLGYSSGNIGPGLEQRWLASPFVVPEGGATINQINADWFIPAGAGAQVIKYKIWNRTGFSQPGALAVSEGNLGPYGPGTDDPRVLGADDWFHQYPGLNIHLPQGEYYLTIYADGGVPGFVQNAAWLTGANQDTIAQNNSFAWRSAQHPVPGFQVYNPPNIQPTGFMGDTREIWNPSFQILGFAYHHASTMSGTIDYAGWQGPNIDFVWRLPLQEPGCGPTYAWRYTPIVAANGYGFSYSGTVSHTNNVFEQVFQHHTWLRRSLEFDSEAGDHVNQVYHLINGDSNGDNEVDIGDFANLSNAFGSVPGDPNWNPMADFNGDDTVDIGDFALLSENFGQIGDC